MNTFVVASIPLEGNIEILALAVIVFVYYVLPQARQSCCTRKPARRLNGEHVSAYADL